MIVRLIASTAFESSAATTATGYKHHTYGVKEADELAELAGRVCYQSFTRPNPDTAENAGYLANILKQQHESVLEHASATFYVAEVSRSLLAEITRHRHLSFSVMSQRFVDEGSATFITPPAIFKEQSEPIQLYLAATAGVRDFYDSIVKYLMKAGYTRKQAREAARSVLPNAVETKFVVTGNMRAWRDVLKKRISTAADAEMQLFAREIFKILKEIAPNTFQDFDAI